MLISRNEIALQFRKKEKEKERSETIEHRMTEYKSEVSLYYLLTSELTHLILRNRYDADVKAGGEQLLQSDRFFSTYEAHPDLISITNTSGISLHIKHLFKDDLGPSQR